MLKWGKIQSNYLSENCKQFYEVVENILQLNDIQSERV